MEPPYNILSSFPLPVKDRILSGLSFWTKRPKMQGRQDIMTEQHDSLELPLVVAEKEEAVMSYA